MNRFATFCVTTAMFVLTVFVPGAQSQAGAHDTNVSVSFFYDDLSPHGHWVEHRQYGTVWIPASAGPEWQPYSYGRWVWTSDYGWYWDSDEEFGWATYHYGRWILTSDYGWVWVPDDVWGPAWVDWRYSEGYVGWAPMPPEYRWRNGAFVEVDLGAPRYTSSWVFVSENDFARGEIRGRRVDAGRNRALISASARVTSYASVDGRIVNRSLDPVHIAARAKIRIAPVRIGAAASLGGRAEIRASGMIPVYRPRVVARQKLDLSAPTDFNVGADVERPSARVDPPDAGLDARGSLAIGVGGSIGRSERPGGLGGGLGVGVGGGRGNILGR